MDNNNKEFARMQHHPVQVTTAGKLAMQQYAYPKPAAERPHEWIKISKDTWVFTNDGTVNQYKGLVRRVPGNRYQCVIRTMSRIPTWSMQFMDLEDAQAWVASSVLDLIAGGDFDFYGPDKTEI